MYLNAYKREALYSDTVGPQLGSFQVLQKKAVEFSSQHIKQALAKGGGFSPSFPCRFQSDHPFRPHLLFTLLLFQKTHFFFKHPLDRTVSSVQIQGPWGQPLHSHLLDRPFYWHQKMKAQQLELHTKTKDTILTGPVLKAFQGKWPQTEAPPLQSVPHQPRIYWLLK